MISEIEYQNVYVPVLVTLMKKINKLQRLSFVCLVIAVSGVLFCLLSDRLECAIIWCAAVIAWANCLKAEKDNEILRTRIDIEEEISVDRNNHVLSLEGRLILMELKNQVAEKILLKKTYETEYLRGNMPQEEYERKGKKLHDECKYIMDRVEKIVNGK